MPTKVGKLVQETLRGFKEILPIRIQKANLQ